MRMNIFAQPCAGDRRGFSRAVHQHMLNGWNISTVLAEAASQVLGETVPVVFAREHRVHSNAQDLSAKNPAETTMDGFAGVIGRNFTKAATVPGQRGETLIGGHQNTRRRK